MNIKIFSSTQDYFIPKVEKLCCQEPTKAYIVSTLSKPPDLSAQSITVAFAEAKSRQEFIKYQNIGDFLLFIETFYPEYLKNASPEYFIAVAQVSYLACFKMTHRKISIYEELADRFKEIVKKLKIGAR